MSETPAPQGTEDKEAQTTPTDIQASREKETHSLGEITRTIVYALLIAVVIRTFTYQPFNIPSGSMIPNLLVGDYLFVSKYAYGYSRYSMPFGPPLFKGRIMESVPERGDIVVFKWPKDNSTDYIKRVLGLPGDRLQMKKGVLYINGEPLERRRVENLELPITPNNRCKTTRYEVEQDDGTKICSYPQYLEILPSGRQYRTLDLAGGLPNDDTVEFYVPEGHYFMVGDNRDDSSDSRVPISQNGVGLVPAENLVGRAEVIFFSTDGSSALWTPWNWFSAMRSERLFSSLRLSDDEE
ncbi:MAG: signal peptidase I [Sphingomonadales bacterium]|jgi:signal peptidase I